MDGDLIGCGTYETFIVERGGRTLVVEYPWTQVSWQRKLDDTSQASVDTAECNAALGQIRPWRHELVVYRDSAPIWVGPVFVPDFQPPDSTKVDARDLSAWWDHRLIHDDHIYDDPTDLSKMFVDVATDAMAPDNSPGLVVAATPCNVLGVQSFLAAQHLIAGAQLRTLSNIGIDWTVIVRNVLAGGVVVPTDAIGTFTDAHFVKPPTTKVDGSTQANSWTVRGAGGGAAGDTVFATAVDLTGIESDGLLESTASISSILDNPSALAAAQSNVALTGEVVIVGSAVLTPTAPFPIDVLIPGALCTLALEDTAVPVHGDYRLQQVDGSGNADGSETITLTFQPLGSGGAGTTGP